MKILKKYIKNETFKPNYHETKYSQNRKKIAKL